MIAATKNARCVNKKLVSPREVPGFAGTPSKTGLHRTALHLCAYDISEKDVKALKLRASLFTRHGFRLNSTNHQGNVEPTKCAWKIAPCWLAKSPSCDWLLVEPKPRHWAQRNYYGICCVLQHRSPTAPLCAHLPISITCSKVLMPASWNENHCLRTNTKKKTEADVL